MRTPSRQELEERIAKYLMKDCVGDGKDVGEVAHDLVNLFNQWTIEVIAPDFDTTDA